MFTETPIRKALLRPTTRRVVSALDAVAAPHGIDGYIEQIAPTWSSTEVRGRITDVDRSAAGSTILTIEANGNWAGFKPGQYTQLAVEIDGVRHTRCYSMASAAPTTETPRRRARRFQLGIKAHPEGLVSQHLLAHAEPGMVVGLTPAAGDFHLPDQRPDRVLLISGGSGITPVVSMLRTLCAEGYDGSVGFLHYATTPEAMLFRAEVEDLARRHPNVTVLTAFDRAPGASDLDGLLSEAHLDAIDADWRDAETYVCGPAPLMDAVRHHFTTAGVPERFHQEAFTLPTFVAEAGDIGGTVRFATSGLSVDSDGRPILDQAEATGLSPTFGCRMGICHTCTRSLTCGTVRDTVTGDLTTVNGSDVEIRVCVSAPVGDVAIDL